MTVALYEACESFVRWLDQRVLFAGRGDATDRLEVEPEGRFWLGRLAPEERVIDLGLGERGERLDPCACGVRVLPQEQRGPWTMIVRVTARCWRPDGKEWAKSDAIEAEVDVEVPVDLGAYEFGAGVLEDRLRSATGDPERSAVVRVDVEADAIGRRLLTVTVVNTTALPPKGTKLDPNLYEVRLELVGLAVQPFLLESLPDSFRYDRRVTAYGINCGVEPTVDGLATTDTVVVERGRPVYWNGITQEPDLRFSTLAEDPIPRLHELVDALTAWGNREWSDATLDRREVEESWTPAMRAEAAAAAEVFWVEVGRVESGLIALESQEDLLVAFRLMNEAIAHSANGRYESWRPFQVGFLLANLRAIGGAGGDVDVVDIVWFATGGGKTETYLGLLVTSALLDRIRGKKCGITAWSRFPLRMLSLQQTQRFADAMAGAELARRRAGIDGDWFAVGFFVGQAATPNSVKLDPQQGEGPDPDDDTMPARYQVLLRCPFCHRESITMGFNRRYWRLEHRCSNPSCPWPETFLPFFVVDEEIYRFLPAVVVGTLDKAASLALNASMRGFVGPPHGLCSEDGHGFTYASRSKRQNGCLVPGCRGVARPITVESATFGPTFRLQDELHLLRDSLGAVDAHYESLLDALQEQLTGRRPKILASSATLSGFDKQVEVLYQRSGRVFPAQGPTATKGFWTTDTDRLARRFVAAAPRGVTLEFAVDRMLTELQAQVRRLKDEPAAVCTEAGVPVAFADDLLSIYGVDVVYGNSLRDLDAATRSLETQVPLTPLNTASLTGRTDFEEVRETLARLERPEKAFGERLHVVGASSMMSHGVDIDRLNVMVVLGVPLTTAEFIQTSARVGRRWPGLVFLMHKIARERDASVYRSFEHFIRQGDRFVEPIPITRRSRRVLARTVAGMEMSRVWTLHEPRAARALSTVKGLREFFGTAGIGKREEYEALVGILGIEGELDAAVRDDLDRWMEAFFANLQDRSGNFRWPKDLCPWGEPMISLRDVEEQAPINQT